MDAYVEQSEVDFGEVRGATNRGNNTAGGRGTNSNNSEGSDEARADSNELPPQTRTADEQKKHRLITYIIQLIVSTMPTSFQL